MTSVPRWEPDGAESPAERTDPLLPAITDDMLPPLELRRLPTLDDRTLAQMLAELDGDESALDGNGSALDREGSALDRGGSALDGNGAAVERDGSVLDGNGADLGGDESALDGNGSALERDGSALDGNGSARDGAAPVEPPLRLVEHPGGPVGYRPARGPVTRNTSKYVRRDSRPPEVHADALSLTGLTRRSRGRIGSILFTVAFVGIFLLILVQAIVSLLTPGT